MQSVDTMNRSCTTLQLFPYGKIFKKMAWDFFNWVYINSQVVMYLVCTADQLKANGVNTFPLNLSPRATRLARTAIAAPLSWAEVRQERPKVPTKANNGEMATTWPARFGAAREK